MKKAKQTPTPPPIICTNDRVLLHYAVLHEAVGFREGHKLLFVDGREIGRVPYLAICQDKDSPNVILYFCDGDWKPLGIGAEGSIDNAKKKAERIYPGSSRCWVEAHFSEGDVAEYLDKAFADLRCSFCGKRPDETMEDTFQSSGNARICGDCITEFYRELNERHESQA